MHYLVARKEAALQEAQIGALQRKSMEWQAWRKWGGFVLSIVN